MTTRRAFLKGITAGLGVSAMLGGSARVLLASEHSRSVGPPTALVSDAICKRHLPDGERAECPQRYDAVLTPAQRQQLFRHA